MTELSEGLFTAARLAKSKAREWEMTLNPRLILQAWVSRIKKDWRQYRAIHDVSFNRETIETFVYDTYGFHMKFSEKAQDNSNVDQGDDTQSITNLPVPYEEKPIAKQDDNEEKQRSHYSKQSPNRLRLMPNDHQETEQEDNETKSFPTRGNPKQLSKPRYRVKHGSEPRQESFDFKKASLIETAQHFGIELFEDNKIDQEAVRIARFILKDPNILQATKSFDPGSALFNQYLQWLNSGHGKHSNYMAAHQTLNDKENTSGASHPSYNSTNVAAEQGRTQAWKDISAMIERETKMTHDQIMKLFGKLAQYPPKDIEQKIESTLGSNVAKKIVISIIRAYKSEYYSKK